MASDYEDYCETWAEKTEVIIMEDESLIITPVRFCLVFHVSFIRIPEGEEDGDEEEEEEDEVLEINNLRESAIETQAFWVTRDQLMSNNDTSQETLQQILSSMQVPSRPVFVEKVLGCARAMANVKTYDEHKILRMHVRMCVVVVVDADDEDGDGDEEEEEEEEGGTAVGASKEAIERLERVKIDDKEELRGPCAICLQGFLLGLQVIRLPNCCHISRFAPCVGMRLVKLV